MEFLEKNGFYFLILAVISELVLPFVLATKMPNYNHLTMLISSFGEADSPTRMVFKIWEITNGTLFLLALPAVYVRFEQAYRPLAIALVVMIGAFAIGDCIITGLVDRSTNLEDISLAGKIHDYSSGVGFAALIIGVAIIIKLYAIEKNSHMIVIITILFIFAAICMALFSAPRMPIIKHFNIPYRGLWQRLNLLFLYLPLVAIAIESLHNRPTN